MPTTLHEGTTFLITTDAGDIDHSHQGETGLYHEDSRFLSEYKLLIDDSPFIPLSTKQIGEREATHYLVNPRITDATSGAIRIHERTLSVFRRQVLNRDFEEEIEIRNYGDGPTTFTLSFQFESDFENILNVKSSFEQSANSFLQGQPIKRTFHPDKRGVTCALDIHGLNRQAVLTFGSKPDRLLQNRAVFGMSLARGEHKILQVLAKLRTDGFGDNPTKQSSSQNQRSVRKPGFIHVAESRFLAPQLETDHEVLADAYSRAVLDMDSLRIKAMDAKCGMNAIVAGIPWYMALFGRDSLIASFQAMHIDPTLARATLLALADLQGKKVDPISLEAPGKILHEHRDSTSFIGNETIQKYPYFGSIDATVLFLITLSEYVHFTGDFAFGSQMWPHVEQALDWMSSHGDPDGDGLLEYGLEDGSEYSNQGWKDSSDSVRFADGRIAKTPIAPIEVQGYAFSAYSRMSKLAQYFGKTELASYLEKRAKKIREKICSLFWLKSRNFFAEALDGKKVLVDSLTSNPGHLLWSGVLDTSQANIVAKRLVSDEMFSGYGIRTMGSNEGGYNPLSYHNGSVWPHDNSLIISGMSQYGLHQEARIVIEGLLLALKQTPDYRFPELFSGFDHQHFGIPVAYPSACKPQAWASGAVLLIVRSLFGLDVNSIQRTVSCSPTAISGMSFLRLKGVRIAGVETEIEMKAQGNKATASVLGLPSNWRQTAA
jgi:glycogen debranching enzyme